jgi:hypothetical protein
LPIGEGTFSLVVGGLPISAFSRLLPSALTPVAIGAILAALDQSSDLAGRAPPFAAAQPTNHSTAISA